MKHIPFGAMPAAERIAVAAAVGRSGLVGRDVCVSRLELPEAGDGGTLPCVTLVTARGWVGRYDTAAGSFHHLDHAPVP
jgi:hypothetical protein